MGRWTTKSKPQQNPALVKVTKHCPSGLDGTALETSNATLHCSGSGTSEPLKSLTAVRPPEEHLTADVITEKAGVLLHACSLSKEQCDTWHILCSAVANATPSADKTRTGPPARELLAALQSARKTREEFVEGLAPEQKENVKKLLELEKQERKLQIKDSSIKWKAQSAVDAGACHSEAKHAVNKEQKDVMTRAFGLWTQDRQRELATNKIDSTEWKRIRAIGGDDPTLRRYLLRAGWDSSWPMPEPEGRLLRREGQDAALECYARK